MIVGIFLLCIIGFTVLSHNSQNYNMIEPKPVVSNPPNLPPPTPRNAVPPFEVLLNGSSVYPSYTVTRGQNIVIFVDATSKQPYLVSLNAHYQSSDKVLPNGITLNLPVNTATLPILHMPLSINIAKSTTPGVYPMAVDASYYNSTDGGHVGFQAGFNLNVQG